MLYYKLKGITALMSLILIFFILISISFLPFFQKGVNDALAAMQQYRALLATNLRSQIKTVFQQH